MRAWIYDPSTWRGGVFEEDRLNAAADTAINSNSIDAVCRVARSTSRLDPGQYIVAVTERVGQARYNLMGVYAITVFSGGIVEIGFHQAV